MVKGNDLLRPLQRSAAAAAVGKNVIIAIISQRGGDDPGMVAVAVGGDGRIDSDNDALQFRDNDIFE